MGEISRDVEDGKLLPHRELFIKKQTNPLKARSLPPCPWKMPQETQPLSFGE
jgi:hypothetical protein